MKHRKSRILIPTDTAFSMYYAIHSDFESTKISSHRLPGLLIFCHHCASARRAYQLGVAIQPAGFHIRFPWNIGGATGRKFFFTDLGVDFRFRNIDFNHVSFFQQADISTGSSFRSDMTDRSSPAGAAESSICNQRDSLV